MEGCKSYSGRPTFCPCALEAFLPICSTGKLGFSYDIIVMGRGLRTGLFGKRDTRVSATPPTV